MIFSQGTQIIFRDCFSKQPIGTHCFQVISNEKPHNTSFFLLTIKHHSFWIVQVNLEREKVIDHSSISFKPFIKGIRKGFVIRHYEELSISTSPCIGWYNYIVVVGSCEHIATDSHNSYVCSFLLPDRCWDSPDFSKSGRCTPRWWQLHGPHV